MFLINTHGLIFGAGAQINVGGLVASTLDLTPSDFLSSHYSLNAHGATAGIINHGLIQAASGGSVSLIGGSVVNDGLIVANYGRINIDGADQAFLDFDGDGLIEVQVTGELKKRLDADEAAVTNTGELHSEGAHGAAGFGSEGPVRQPGEQHRHHHRSWCVDRWRYRSTGRERRQYREFRNDQRHRRPWWTDRRAGRPVMCW